MVRPPPDSSHHCSQGVPPKSGQPTEAQGVRQQVVVRQHSPYNSGVPGCSAIRRCVEVGYSCGVVGMQGLLVELRVLGLQVGLWMLRVVTIPGLLTCIGGTRGASGTFGTRQWSLPTHSMRRGRSHSIPWEGFLAHTDKTEEQAKASMAG